MGSMFDNLTGETPGEERPVRRTSSGWGQKPNRQRPSRDTTTGDKPQSRGQRNVRPDSVSERVWGLAEQWLEMGEAHFGKRPPVNKQEFSKRLAAKINGDQNLRKWLRIRPEKWQETFAGRWDCGQDFVNDVLVRMLEMFYEFLTEDQKLTSTLQFAFLEDEWDEWVYQAVTSVQIRWHKEHGTWVKYDLPKAVFDPTTVGVPQAEDPCTDPFYPEGITWGEAWEMDRQWLEEHPEAITARDDSDDLDPELEARQVKTVETMARLKRVILANRETTTKETNE